jgi:hypothetical protein
MSRFFQRVTHKALFGLAMLLCIAWSFTQARQAPATTTPAGARFQEWPAQWDGEPLRPLALGEVEQRFAQRFPGAIARMTDGRRTLVLRRVDQPTRMLHPATDCYRALGWRIENARLVQDGQTRLWRCFIAQAANGGERLQVCERIVDAHGQTFTDSSAWYWAAQAGRSTGPWQAVTVAAPAD